MKFLKRIPDCNWFEARDMKCRKRVAAGGRAEAVYRALKRAIIDQALPSGSKLPEGPIGERLGVSRTLIRGALIRLSQEGLVELRPNKGAAVANPSLEEGRNLFLTRMALERLVVETLSGQLTKEQINTLATHVANEESARTESEISIRLAGEFHTLLAHMTNNDSLIRYVNELVARSSLILALYARPKLSECAGSEHRELLDKLVAGKTREAVTLMMLHLDSITVRSLLPRKGNLNDILSTYGEAEGLSVDFRREVIWAGA